MAILINNAFTGSNLGDTIAGETIKGGHFESFIGDQGRLFAVQGLRCSLFTEYRDPSAGEYSRITTSSETYTQVNSSTTYNATNLDMFSPCFRGFRDLETAVIHIRYAAFLRNASVRLTVYASDTDTTFASTILVEDSDVGDWRYGTFSMTSAQAREGGLIGGDPRLLSLQVELKNNFADTGVTSGQLYQLSVREYILTSADTSLIPQ